jgi:hypothetical protein
MARFIIARRRVVALLSLTVDADVAELAAVGFDEFFRLHEHAAGTAAGIVNAAFVRSEHLDEETHDALRSVELAAFHAFVFVGIFRIGTGVIALIRRQLLMVFFEAVGDVLKKDQPEDDMLVLGRVHVATELVGCEPKLSFEANVSGIVGRGAVAFCARHFRGETNRNSSDGKRKAMPERRKPTSERNLVSLTPHVFTASGKVIAGAILCMGCRRR